MDKYIGKLLDNRYEILQVIGTGGMAVVYKAMCHRLKRLVAVKILKDEFSKDEEFRNRFHAESQAVAMLSHQNIVAVHDVSRSNSVEYIVMELIDGITLKQYMERKGAMSWKEALHFICQVLKALDHAHSKGIIHRDIKPHNIMVLRDGTIKVTDFGIARFAAEQGTLTNEALGSVHYISPEQARGGKLDSRADIYSTGVVLYEMLTGRLPFDGDTPVAIAIQHINSMPLSPRDINPEIPETLEKIIMRAMCANRDGRYSSADEMLSDLEAFRKNPKIVINFEELPFNEEPIISKPKKAPPQKIEDEWEEDKPKSKLSAYMPKIAVAGVAILFLIGLWTMLSATLGWGNKDTTVPNLLGADIEEVLADKEYESFSIKEEAREYSSEYEEGKIIAQRPEAGKSIKKNGEIKVVVSRGAKLHTLPAVAGMTEKQARIELETRLGLFMKVEYEESEDVIEGHVIGSKPEADSEVREGDTIVVYVSKEEIKKVKVPELIGLSKESAEKAIEEAKLKVGTISTKDSDKREGEVIDQSIDVDTEVEEGTEIDITISVNSDVEEPSKEEPPKQDEPPKEENPPEEENPPKEEIPTVNETSKTLPIKLPSSPETMTVRVTVNGKESYNKTHNASEGTINVTIKGSGTAQVKVYINDSVHHDITVTF